MKKKRRGKFSKERIFLRLPIQTALKAFLTSITLYEKRGQGQLVAGAFRKRSNCLRELVAWRMRAALGRIAGADGALYAAQMER